MRLHDFPGSSRRSWNSGEAWETDWRTHSRSKFDNRIFELVVRKAGVCRSLVLKLKENSNIQYLGVPVSSSRICLKSGLCQQSWGICFGSDSTVSSARCVLVARCAQKALTNLTMRTVALLLPALALANQYESELQALKDLVRQQGQLIKEQELRLKEQEDEGRRLQTAP